MLRNKCFTGSDNAANASKAEHCILQRSSHTVHCHSCVPLIINSPSQSGPKSLNASIKNIHVNSEQS